MRQALNTLLARLLIGSAIPLILFLSVGLVSGIIISRLLAALRIEKHTHEVISRALQLQQTLDRLRLSTDTGHRREVLATFQELAFRLKDQVSDNPVRTAMATLILDRLDLLRERNLSTLKPNEVLLRKIDADLDRFIEAEQELLAERREQTETQTRQALPVIGISACLALLFMIILSINTARSVTLPVAKLREVARQLIAGRYQSVTPNGPTEIADLTVLFNQMALTLAQRNSLLEQQTEKYRTYVGVVANILWNTDGEGQVIGDMPTWRAYTGQREEDILGEGWFEAIHPEDREQVIRAWHESLENRSIFEAEYRLRRATGEFRHFSCRGVPITADNGRIREWVGTCTDVTDSKQRRELEQARDAAESANRTKSEFLARMSHELRTPLNAIIGMSKMLATQRFGKLTIKQADYIGDIVQAGQHLLELINDILDLAKVEVGKMTVQPESISIQEFVQPLISTLRPLAESKRLVLRLHPMSEDGVVRTDPARLRQILFNLLSNAIKFTPSGEVDLSWKWVAAVSLDAPEVVRPHVGAIRIDVKDTGIGIAPEDHEVVWDEFRQLRPSSAEAQQGTGLGLALTRKLVHLLGGLVGLESEPNKGSTFTVVLPC